MTEEYDTYVPVTSYAATRVSVEDGGDQVHVDDKIYTIDEALELMKALVEAVGVARRNGG